MDEMDKSFSIPKDNQKLTSSAYNRYTQNVRRSPLQVSAQPNGNTELFIEQYSVRKSRRANRSVIKINRTIARTGKPYCGTRGIYNPAILNISSETLQKIKKD